ncbi:MAG: hypothetical protein Q8O79_06575 [Pseudomonadota bacterium]|nr:hypothetical protein [Pseudomonadota bacterium]
MLNAVVRKWLRSYPSWPAETVIFKPPGFTEIHAAADMLRENHKITIGVHEKHVDDCLSHGGNAECSQLPGFGQWQQAVTDHVVSLQPVKTNSLFGEIYAKENYRSGHRRPGFERRLRSV